MDRNATNFIRIILGDHVPAARHDSVPRLFTARRVVGNYIGARQKLADDTLEFRSARIDQLLSTFTEFETIVCNHMREHVLDFRGALAELRRVAATKVIVVVPKVGELSV